jgi:beta-phosphoglucomutase
MLEAIIFDFDGVIVDSHPAHLAAWRDLLESLGKPTSDAALHYVLDGHKREEILRHFLGDLTPAEAESHGRRKEALFREYAQPMQLIAGVGEFLGDVERAGFAAAVASSASRRRVQTTLEELKIARYFRVIVTAEDVANGKPDPEIFLLAARRLGVPADNALVCEDAASGVAAARSAGMKCLAIAQKGRGPMLLAAGAERVIGDFTEARIGELARLWATPANTRMSLAAP